MSLGRVLWLPGGPGSVSHWTVLFGVSVDGLG